MSAVLGSRRRVAPQPSSLAIRPVLFLTGGMLVALAATMLGPMALDFLSAMSIGKFLLRQA